MRCRQITTESAKSESENPMTPGGYPTRKRQQRTGIAVGMINMYGTMYNKIDEYCCLLVGGLGDSAGINNQPGLFIDTQLTSNIWQM
jgi:hypothetical protein